MSNFISRLIGISNTRKSSHDKLATEEGLAYSPVTALRVGDMIDGPCMLDLVLRLERVGDTVRVTTNSGAEDYAPGDTVKAYRRVKHPRTGDYHLVLVR